MRGVRRQLSARKWLLNPSIGEVDMTQEEQVGREKAQEWHPEKHIFQT